MEEFDLQMINEMIETAHEAIDKLRSQYCRTNGINDAVKVTKAVARLSEDIRKLLRMRANLQKEEKTKNGA